MPKKPRASGSSTLSLTTSKQKRRNGRRRSRPIRRPPSRRRKRKRNQPNSDSTSIMKAVTFAEFGGSDVFKMTEIARPEPGPDDVLVRIHAAGICHHDLLS